MGRPLLSVGAGARDPLGRVPQPRTPSCPYLQGGQQSGQLGELLLEGLVLLLILAGGGAGSLVSQGRAARLPGDHRMGRCHCPPALRTLPRQPPCALSLPAFLTGHWAVRSPGRGGAWPGYLKGGWGAGRGPHSPLHSLQQQRSPLRQFVLGGTVCYRPGTPSPAAAQRSCAPLGLRYTLALRPTCRPGSLSLRPACLHPAAWESQSPHLKHHLLGEVLPDQPRHQRQLG